MRTFQLAAFAALAIATAQAGTLTYNFSGRLNYIEDNGSYFGGQFAPGNAVTGTLTIDDTVPDGLPDEPNRGYYLYTHPNYTLTTVVQGSSGTVTWTTGASAYTMQVFVYNDYFGEDSFLAQQYQSAADCSFGAAVPDPGNCIMLFNPRDSSDPLNFLDSDALPTTLDFARVNGGGGLLLAQTYPFDPELGYLQPVTVYALGYTFDFIPESTIPEPKVWSLTVAGLLALGLARRIRYVKR